MKALNFAPFPYLTTASLLLRPLEIEDRDKLFVMRSDITVAQYLDRPLTKRKEEVDAFIQKIQSLVTNNESIMWAIVQKEQPGLLLGTICVWQFNEAQNSGEIGYELLADHQGKGIIQEAVEAVIAYGFNTLELQKITAEVHRKNKKSIRVLERNHFRLDSDSEGQQDPNYAFYCLWNTR